jgi:hypothetical protein
MGEIKDKNYGSKTGMDEREEEARVGKCRNGRMGGMT